MTIINFSCPNLAYLKKARYEEDGIYYSDFFAYRNACLWVSQFQTLDLQTLSQFQISYLGSHDRKPTVYPWGPGVDVISEDSVLEM